MTPEEFLAYFKRALNALPWEYRCPWHDWSDTESLNRFYERVFAYELYHQLRCILPSNEYVINGEPGKAYRNIVGIGSKFPDLIYHVPGTDDCNLAVIEVKVVPKNVCEYRKDIAKLCQFRREPLAYKVGILTLFGDSINLSQALQQIEGIAPCEGEEIVILALDLADGVRCHTIRWQP